MAEKSLTATNLDIINKAFQIANKYGTKSLTKIAEKIDCKVIQDSNVKKLAPNELGAAMCIIDEGKWFIIYDDTQVRSECRFTIAHELGHIFLEHKDIAKSDDKERQADLFAFSLLYPELILSILCKKFRI